MRLQFLLVLVLACVAVGMDDVSVPNTHVDSGIIYAADFNANNDTLEARINGNKDTLEVKFIRFTDMNDGDSTLDTVKVNAIRGNPDIDSISGNPLIDSLAVAYVSVDTIRSKPDVDSLQGRPWVDTLDLDALRGNPDVDSLGGRPYIDTVETNAIRGNPDVDSLAGAIVMDTIRGNPDVDSIAGNPRVDSATVGYVDIDTLGGDTVKVTSVASLSDSVVSTSGARFTNLVSEGNLRVDGSVRVDSTIRLNTTSVTIASNTITPNASNVQVDTEGSVALDTIATISGGFVGDILVIRSTNPARDIVVLDAVDLFLGADRTLGTTADVLTLICVQTGNLWAEVSWADN